MDRRRLLRLAASVPALALPDLLVVRGDRVSAAGEVLDSFESGVGSLVAGYDQTAAGEVVLRVRRDLPLVNSLIKQGGHSGRYTVRLHRVAGRLYALRGNAMHDLGDSLAATGDFAEAFLHSSAGADRQVMAWVRCWQSSLSRRGGNWQGALALAEDARRIALGGTPQAARADLCRAWAYATGGDQWNTHEAVDMAWRGVGELEGADHGTPGFSFDSLHTSDVGEMTASVYVQLGRPASAAAYAETVMTDLDICRATFRQSRVRVSAATAEIRRDYDRALSLVGEALDISADRPCARLSSSIVGFVEQARRRAGRDDPGLRDLTERVRAWQRPPAA